MPIRDWIALWLREPLIQAVFFLERSGVVRFAGQPLLFSRDAENAPLNSPLGPSEVSGGLQAARILELRDQDYPEALAAYRQVYSGASEDRLRGEALNAIARIQAKSGSLPEAAESYARLRREFGAVADGERDALRSRRATGARLGPTSRR